MESSLQGELGSGDSIGEGSFSITLRDLVPGAHEITATLLRGNEALTRSEAVDVLVTQERGQGLRVVGRLDPSPIGSYADLWLEGSLIALGTRSFGAAHPVFLIDVSRPEEPRLASIVTTQGGGQDVHLWRGYLYMETGEIYDVRDPGAARFVTRLPAEDYDVFVSGDRLYSSPGSDTPGGVCRSGRVSIFDVSRPEEPQLLGELTGNGSAHELHEVDGILYGAYCTGYCAVDVRNPSDPHLLGCADGGRHSAFRHASRPLVFTTNESGENSVQIWDVSLLDAPVQLGEYRSNGLSQPHQIWAAGDLLYVAGYTAGVEIVDVSVPSEPRRVAFYDTFEGPDGGFDGVWGVVVGPDSLIYAADTSTGLWIFALESGS